MLLALIHKTVNFGWRWKFMFGSLLLNLLVLVIFFCVTWSLHNLIVCFLNINRTRCNWSFEVFWPEGEIERVFLSCETSRLVHCARCTWNRAGMSCKRTSSHRSGHHRWIQIFSRTFIILRTAVFNCIVVFNIHVIIWLYWLFVLLSVVGMTFVRLKVVFLVVDLDKLLLFWGLIFDNFIVFMIMELTVTLLI